MRKKTGNLVVELLTLAFSIAIIVMSLFFGPLGTETTLFGMAIGHSYSNISEAFKNIKVENLNLLYCVGLVLPLVTSVIAVLFKRLRIFNVLNLLGWSVLIFVLFYSVYSISIVSNFIDFFLNSVDKLYYIIIGGAVLGFAGSFLNTELCR